MPVAKAALASFEEASQNGLGAADGSGLSVYWANRGTSADTAGRQLCALTRGASGARN